MTLLKTIWWKLYPNDDKHRWMPLIWLPLLIWFFVDPLSQHRGVLGWTVNTAVGLIFIWLYLQAFSRRDPYRLLSILAMTTIAAIVIPFNGGAIGFLIYAAAAGGFHPNLGRVSLLIALDAAILAFYVHRLELPIALLGLNVVAHHCGGIRQPLWSAQPLRGREASSLHRMRSSTWPRLPSASALLATCTTCWDTRSRSSP